MTLIRHVSFVDCPGHDILMATMLNGAAVMDAALLLIAGNEPCPQPQTKEHLAAVEIMRLKHIIVLQVRTTRMNGWINKHQALGNFWAADWRRNNRDLYHHVMHDIYWASTHHYSCSTSGVSTSGVSCSASSFYFSIPAVLFNQNKVELIKPSQAVEHFGQIKEFIAGSAAQNAPIIPVRNR